MKYVDEFRDRERVARLLGALRGAARRPWTLMEVCGGQTHAFLRFGLDRMLPPRVTLVHGPGCPVCVTPAGLIDAAVTLAQMPGVALATFGDMARVPGSRTSLLAARARGADVRFVYSPLDALALARRMPEVEVVFFAVGFETTAPTTAATVLAAARDHVPNFSLLAAHVRVPPAMEAILSAADNRVDGFLAAGHVCTVTGEAEYHPIAARFGVPIVVTGFEPVDLLAGLLACIRRLEAGAPGVENAYARAARSQGNPTARRIVETVFEPVDREFRGLGPVPGGGLALRPAFTRFDALRRFSLTADETAEDTRCRAGEVLRGVLRPDACPAFGAACTPEHPLGAPMVSAEGACAAYYRHRRRMAEPAA